MVGAEHEPAIRTELEGLAVLVLGAEVVAAGDCLECKGLRQVRARKVRTNVGQLADESRRCETIRLELVKAHACRVRPPYERGQRSEVGAFTVGSFAYQQDRFLHRSTRGYHIRRHLEGKSLRVLREGLRRDERLPGWACSCWVVPHRDLHRRHEIRVVFSKAFGFNVEDTVKNVYLV